MWNDQVVVLVAVCTKEMSKEYNLEALLDGGMVPTIYVPRENLNNPLLLDTMPNLTGVWMVMGTKQE